MRFSEQITAGRKLGNGETHVLRGNEREAGEVGGGKRAIVIQLRKSGKLK
jgi:hypothetical protein